MTLATETSKADIIASIIQDAQEAIELATGERLTLKVHKSIGSKPIEMIAETICPRFNVTLKEMLGKSRKRRIVDARKALALLSYAFNGKNPYLVSGFLKRDRTTAMHYIEEGGFLLATDRAFEEKYFLCREEIELINPEK